jgi:hypothetical protein
VRRRTDITTFAASIFMLPAKKKSNAFTIWTEAKAMMEDRYIILPDKKLFPFIRAST